MRDISLKLLDFADFVELKGFDYVNAKYIRNTADLLNGLEVETGMSKTELAMQLYDIADMIEMRGDLSEHQHYNEFHNVIREAADLLQKEANENNYEYVVAIDPLGCLGFYKAEEDDVDDLLAELEEEGKMFAVVGCGEISDDTLTLKAELWRSNP